MFGSPSAMTTGSGHLVDSLYSTVYTACVFYPKPQSFPKPKQVVFVWNPARGHGGICFSEFSLHYLKMSLVHCIDVIEVSLKV